MSGNDKRLTGEDFMAGNQLRQLADPPPEVTNRFTRDGWLPHITAEAISDALDGFPLPLQPSGNIAWLAMAVRRALAITIPSPSEGPDRQTNAETKAELNKLASRASQLWREIFECSSAADTAILDFTWRNWDGEGGEEFEGLTIGLPPDYRVFRDTIPKLNWLAGILRDVASAIPSQKGPWKKSEQRELRIRRAQVLSTVFEQSFGVQPTVNTWPGSDGGPWPDFYQRIVAVAFNEKATPDLEGVLDAARRRHKNNKVIFASGIMPDFPL